MRGPQNRERQLGLSGRLQAELGAVVSFRNEHGKALVLHATGPILHVVRELCDQAAALDQSFRVVCISTPYTIYADLQGREILDNLGAQRPEGHTLRRAGRWHMFHPDLIGLRREPRHRA